MSMVEKIPGRLEKAVAEVLAPNETVHVKLQGGGKEALICTDRRVIIVKAGFTRGATLGTNVFQVSYDKITGVEVKYGLINGYFEVSAGGVQNANPLFNASAAQRPNCVYLDSRKQARAFREVCTWIMVKTQPAADNPTPAPAQDDILSMIEKLGDLRDKNLLTDGEYDAKKAELLARL